MRSLGHEYGVTTGRPRRCGWLDTVVVKYTAMINGFTRCIVQVMYMYKVHVHACHPLLSSLLIPQCQQSTYCCYQVCITDTCNFVLFCFLFSICLTKLDILDSFEELKIGVAYKLDGKVLDSMPGQQKSIEHH